MFRGACRGGYLCAATGPTLLFGYHRTRAPFAIEEKWFLEQGVTTMSRAELFIALTVATIGVILTVVVALGKLL